jgi:hypothetical protein
VRARSRVGLPGGTHLLLLRCAASSPSVVKAANARARGLGAAD